MSMRKHRTRVSMLALSAMPLIVGGCAMGPFNTSGPIIEDKLGKFRTLAVTAERRVIMFNDDHKYCAEPPPDVAQNIASTLRLAAEASGSLPAEGRAEVSRSMASAAQRLMNRSQGLQLYRDGMYYLCQAMLNEIVDKVEFKDRSMALLEATRDLVSQEIKAANGQINAAPSASLPTVQPLPPPFPSVQPPLPQPPRP